MDLLFRPGIIHHRWKVLVLHPDYLCPDGIISNMRLMMTEERLYNSTELLATYKCFDDWGASSIAEHTLCWHNAASVEKDIFVECGWLLKVLSAMQRVAIESMMDVITLTIAVPLEGLQSKPVKVVMNCTSWTSEGL
jgi:hypothetical protein